MKRRLFLHIGRPKVGSTALQNFLWNNRLKLAENGLLYPQSVVYRCGSHKLALVFQPDLHDARAVANDSAQSVYAAMVEEAAAAGANRVVASSENLFLIDPARPAALLREAFDTTIVCYVRRQDEVLASSFVQEVREGSADPGDDVVQYARAPERLRWLDYAEVLAPWARAFGPENIVVRVFEKGQMKASILEDFLDVLDVAPEGLRMSTDRANPSPARDVLDYMRILRESPELGPVLKDRLYLPLLSLSERMSRSGPFDSTAMVPASVRREILDRFAVSNAAVARTYLGRADGVLFRDTHVPETADSASYSGLDLERFAHMTAALFCRQQKRIEVLQRQLAGLNRQIEELRQARSSDRECDLG